VPEVSFPDLVKMMVAHDLETEAARVRGRVRIR
jgi:hypothetical protein